MKHFCIRHVCNLGHSISCHLLCKATPFKHVSAGGFLSGWLYTGAKGTAVLIALISLRVLLNIDAAGTAARV